MLMKSKISMEFLTDLLFYVTLIILIFVGLLDNIMIRSGRFTPAIATS